MGLPVKLRPASPVVGPDTGHRPGQTQIPINLAQRQRTAIGGDLPIRVLSRHVELVQCHRQYLQRVVAYTAKNLMQAGFSTSATAPTGVSVPSSGSASNVTTLSEPWLQTNT